MVGIYYSVAPIGHATRVNITHIKALRFEGSRPTIEFLILQYSKQSSSCFLHEKKEMKYVNLSLLNGHWGGK